MSENINGFKITSAYNMWLGLQKEIMWAQSLYNIAKRVIFCYWNRIFLFCNLFYKAR